MVANLDDNNLKWEWEQQRDRDRYVWKRKQKTRQRMYTRFQFSRFQAFELRFQIPMFIFWHIQFQFSKLSLLDFRFHSFRSLSFLIAELGFPNFDLHTIDTFKLRVPFVFLWLLTFSAFRFQNYSFLVFDLPISNIRLQMGSIQLQIVILEFAFSFHSDVRCQMLQNGWLLRMGSTHLATGMMLG